MSDSERDDLFESDVTGMWRLFTNVQRLGFETAASVARRFGRLVDEDLGPRWGLSQDKGLSDEDKKAAIKSPEDRIDDTVQSAMNAYADLMQASWDAFNAVMDLTLDISRPWVRGLSRDHVDLRVAKGQQAEGSFYLHNTTSEEAEAVLVSTDGLIGPSGELIKKDLVEFDPSRIESIPAGKSQKVVITVDTGNVAPGRYVGQLWATTDPKIRLDLAIVVTEKEE